MQDEILKKLERTMNRRSFLRGSGLAAAALAGMAAFPLPSAGQDRPPQEPDKKDERKDEPDGKKDEQTGEVDEFKITRKDERGRDYRICPQCGSNMYKQDRTWTCENCGYSYTE